jgi:PAS domain S-box-containing protein
MRGSRDAGGILRPADAGEFSESILEASTEYSIIGQALDGTILLWNSGAKRLYGYQVEEVVGKAKTDILHTPEDLAAGLPESMRQAAMTDGKWEGTVIRVRRDGSRFTAKVVLTPSRDRDGSPVGFLLISKDITGDIQLTHELETPASSPWRSASALCGPTRAPWCRPRCATSPPASRPRRRWSRRGWPPSEPTRRKASTWPA